VGRKINISVDRKLDHH